MDPGAGPPPPDDMMIAVIRALGSVAGSMLALAFQPPKSTLDAFLRGLFSVLCGFIFGAQVQEYALHWADTLWNWMAASALTAALSWPVWSVVIPGLPAAWKAVVARFSAPKE